MHYVLVDDVLDALPEDKLPGKKLLANPQGNVRAFVADVYSRAFPLEYEMHPCSTRRCRTILIWHGKGGILILN